MSFDFKALAERAVTVKVGGKPVHLRLPSREAKKAVVEAFAVPIGAPPDEAAQSPDEAIHRWNIACGKALAATVVGHDDTTEEVWSRIAVASGTEHDEDFAKLTMAAMSLCGFQQAVETLRQTTKDSESGVIDHVQDADASLGNLPTK